MIALVLESLLASPLWVFDGSTSSSITMKYRVRFMLSQLADPGRSRKRPLVTRLGDQREFHQAGGTADHIVLVRSPVSR